MIPSDIQVNRTYQLNVSSAHCLKCGLWKPYHGLATYLGIHADTHIFRWETCQECNCGETLIEYHETVSYSLIDQIKDASRSPEPVLLPP